jgi:hypothetical protein
MPHSPFPYKSNPATFSLFQFIVNMRKTMVLSHL